jgi:excisionase family DNA binding protein
MPEDLNQKIAAQSAHNGGGRPTVVERSFEPLLDTEEAARLLRMHPRTLRTKARSGAIPAVQVGRRWRFRVSALNHWLDEIAS